MVKERHALVVLVHHVAGKRRREALELCLLGKHWIKDRGPGAFEEHRVHEHHHSVGIQWLVEETWDAPKTLLLYPLLGQA